MVRSRTSIWLISLIVILALPTAALANDDKPLKVGFIFLGSTSDRGWNSSHNQGKLYLESKLHDKILVSVAENVPENSQLERVAEKMVKEGDKLIFSTSYGYLEPLARVAARHPEVVFMQVNRFSDAKNIGTYVSWLYEPMYVAGVVAGRMTKSNKLGFIAAHPVPTLLLSINAFEMGARSVNPKVTTRVIFTNSWNDPALEVEALKSLKEAAADVVTYELDNQSAILSNAKQMDLKVVGCYTNAENLAPKQWLTGASFDWGPLYLKITNSVIAKTWTKQSYTSGIKEGYVLLSPLGESAPENVKTEASRLKDNIAQGNFVIFRGPLKDREGRERLAKNEVGSTGWLDKMDFLVDGVEGALPH